MVNQVKALAAGAERRLQELGIVLPPQPTPLGAYVEAVRSGNLVFFSGMLPVINREPRYIGRVGGVLTAEDGRKAAETAALSALAAAKDYLGSLDRVAKVVKLGVYIATEGDFRDHPKVADGASQMLLQVFGEEKLSGRVVLGVASLPLGVPVELELVLEVDG
ncbi:putative translation initiation inhibitor, yjgF family [Rhizobium leguminosarum bv. trifolii WSM2297]|uniref:Putative translation initiation inhibitor, yjgF family n=1 Tax=Rhizobium leguminosarum bv. trifolii WSM2297 TaxID=754762 RepID=J0W4H0_RHILT|nr:RidA family protein [Rhizobium leguminosarum]EJC80068.1 putative translation initiation inhibitor, yjgF family [Rhizobium leguminosarum bv. trifolii WSM2297]